MLKATVLVILFLFTAVSISVAQYLSYISYSSSLEFNDSIYFNHGPRLELLWERSSPDRFVRIKGNSIGAIHNLGLDFILRNNVDVEETEYVLNANYNFILYKLIESFSTNGLGIGTNLSYNISKDIWGISPQINFTHIGVIFSWLFNIGYRYNVYINSYNSHEIGFTAGIFNLASIFIRSRFAMKRNRRNFENGRLNISDDRYKNLLLGERYVNRMAK